MALYHPANMKILEEMKPIFRLPPIERIPAPLPDGFLPPANAKGAKNIMLPIEHESSRRKSKKEKKEIMKAASSGGVAALTSGGTPTRRAVKAYLQSRIDELASD